MDEYSILLDSVQLWKGDLAVLALTLVSFPAILG